MKFSEAESLYLEGRYEDVIRLMSDLDSTLSENYDLWFESVYLLAMSNYFSNNYSKALDLLDVLEKEASQRKDLRGVFISYLVRSYVLFMTKGVKPVEPFLEVLEQRFSFKFKSKFISCKDVFIGLFYHFKGLFWLVKGHYPKAIENFNTVVSLLKDKGGCELFLSLAYNNLGLLFFEKLELDKSLEYHQNALVLRKKVGNNVFISASLFNLGDIHFVKRFFDEANEYYLEGVSILEEVNGPVLFLARGYYRLVRNNVESKDLDVAKKFLEKLSSFNTRYGSNYYEIRSLYFLGRARYLLSLHRLSSFVMAQEILLELIEGGEDTIPSPYLFEAYYLYLKTKLHEAKIFNSFEVLEEIDRVANKLIEASERNNIYHGLVKVLFLRAQLEFMLGRLSSAKEFLFKTWQTMVLLNDMSLEPAVNELMEKIFRVSDQLSSSKVADFSKEEVFLETLVSLEGTLDTFLWLVPSSKRVIYEEKPIFFLIVQEISGNLVFSYNFEKKMGSESLISGLLAAVNLFAKKVFNEDSIEVMKFSNYSVLMSRSKGLIFSYVFSGPTILGKTKLESLVELICDDDEILDYLSKPVFKVDIEKEVRIKALIRKVFKFV